MKKRFPLVGRRALILYIIVEALVDGDKCSPKYIKDKILSRYKKNYQTISRKKEDSKSTKFEKTMQNYIYPIVKQLKHDKWIMTHEKSIVPNPPKVIVEFGLGKVGRKHTNKVLMEKHRKIMDTLLSKMKEKHSNEYWYMKEKEVKTHANKLRVLKNYNDKFFEKYGKQPEEGIRILKSFV
jgi:hypothetical protein